MKQKVTQNTQNWAVKPKTAMLILSDGTIIKGYGIGAKGHSQAEVCFNTAMTGYQEILTDPSYRGQIVTFTFPHIGNVGTNDEDMEMIDEKKSGAVAAIFRECPTNPSNYRAVLGLSQWMEKKRIIGLYGIDTRALTARIRENGLANAVIAHDENGEFEVEKLLELAQKWEGLEGCDLVPEVTSENIAKWSETAWKWNEGYRQGKKSEFHIVAIDFGVKRNILRLFAELGCKVSVVPATTKADEIINMKPDGVFLSNGPGDPAATGEYVVPELKKLLEVNLPIFGICLGHQILALALGGETVKMHQGHHGANHPVKDHVADKVEIVSMNHGFAVDADSLPKNVVQTHVSLFDGTNCGMKVEGKPVFSVQHHPEASPGPQDSHNLFNRFLDVIRQNQGER